MGGVDTCYYDGHCGLCRRSRGVLTRLDWLGRLAWKDMTAVAPEELPVPWEVALSGLPMRTADGRVLVGFEAVRRALRRTPVGWPGAMLLHVPGIAWIGRRVYRRIADNRGRACATGVG
jgi:predicted DCC family thiol-disulfide oxidoreductase YuxK